LILKRLDDLQTLEENKARNQPMLHLFRRAGHQLEITHDASVYEIVMLFDPPQT
jgi:hypothetical protein